MNIPKPPAPPPNRIVRDCTPPTTSKELAELLGFVDNKPAPSALESLQSRVACYVIGVATGVLIGYVLHATGVFA